MLLCCSCLSSPPPLKTVWVICNIVFICAILWKESSFVVGAATVPSFISKAKAVKTLLIVGSCYPLNELYTCPCMLLACVLL